MIKNIKKLISSIFVVCMILSSLTINVFADNGLSISASASSVTSGSTFTVTIKASNNVFVEGLKLSVSGGSITTNLGKSSLDKGETTTAKIKLTGDTCTVTVTGNSANYTTETEAKATAKVTVKKKTTTPTKPTVTKSSDNKLSSLTVSEGTLTSDFKADVTEYNVNVGATVSKITLSAKANHDKAKVSGTGEKTLNVGKNTFEVKCTAENGSVKTYKVNVHVDETPLVFTTYKDQRLGVVRNTAGLGVPKTFEKTTITLDGQSVEAYQSNQFNKTIVYLQTDAGEKNFYIHEEGNGIVSIFKPVSICGVNVYVYDIAESDIVRDNMTYQSVNVGGVEMNGWVFVNPRYENYSLIKVMNEFGNEVMYSYEKTEGTLQLYTEYVEEEEQVVEESEISTLEYILMGTTGFFALTTLIAFVSHLRFKKKSIAAIKDYYQRRNQE